MAGNPTGVQHMTALLCHAIPRHITLDSKRLTPARTKLSRRMARRHLGAHTYFCSRNLGACCSVDFLGPQPAMS